MRANDQRASDDDAVSFAPVGDEHVPLLKEWLAAPHVQRWWGDPVVELELIRNGRETGEADGYIAYVGGEPAGYVQSWEPLKFIGVEPWIADLAPGTIGVDIFIGPENMVGRGIGSRILKVFVARLRAQGRARIIIDPDASNERAIAAYEKAGFVRDRVVPAPDGDTLLMTHLTYQFCSMTKSDLPLVHDWLARPHVREWWHDADDFEFVSGELDHPDLAQFIVAFDERPFAYLQCYRMDDAYKASAWNGCFGPQPEGTRGIDQFIGEVDMLGCGHGSAFIRQFVERLLKGGVPRIVIDPSPDNPRAIRAYEKAGFCAVREIDTPDGRALLMERDK